MIRKVLGAVSIACVLGGAQAAEWGWKSRFTSESSEELREIHAQIHAAQILADVQGVPVKDVTWSADSFELRMIDGAIYLEPEIEGYPAGALFVGQGAVSFAADDPRVRSDLQHFLGATTMENEPVSFAYFFTLSGQSLLDQLGVEGDAEVPLETVEPYRNCKKAMRQLGTELTHAFLNRQGHSDGAAWVLFAPESFGEAGFEDAHLLYTFDPQQKNEVKLDVFGHKEAIRDPRARPFLERYPHYQYYFWPVTYLRAETPIFVPEGNVSQYTTRLSIGAGGSEVEQTTKIMFVPSEGVSALRLELTPRLEVTSVMGPDGEPLPFLQWKFLADDPINFDEHVVVYAKEPLPAGVPYQLEVVSGGPLFDAFLSTFVLADEGTWYPQVNDSDGAVYELFCNVPRNTKAVGTGVLLSEEVADGKRRYHYRTSRPYKRSTFYYGNYETYDAKADDTKVRLYASSAYDDFDSTVRPEWEVGEYLTVSESPKHAANEVANAVKVYNRLLGHPLEIEELRVATTPTFHGRGFEGLILLSKYAGTKGDSSAADFFRAHEVAHQWWGNMVDSENWPEDRWIMESFAEYMAMEYYQLRFDKPAKTRQQVRERWIKPQFRSSTETAQTLTGETRRVAMSQLTPLIAGGGNVYTKGPLMIHMLRYLFQIQKKNDEAFWELLSDFLATHKYQQASTEDFKLLTEQHLQGKLDWFWDQWLYGTEIPEVEWSYDVRRNEEGDFLLTVDAEQKGTEFVLAIPIYVHLRGGKTLSTPLILRGKEGHAQARLREKPTNVTLNDNFESLVSLKKR